MLTMLALVALASQAAEHRIVLDPADPTGLEVDFMPRPLGVDRSVVRFSWQLPPDRDTQRAQVAARVVVSAAHAVAGPPGHVAAAAAADVVYDSGRVATGQPEFTNHGAPIPFASDTGYAWTVQVWTAANATSTSAPAVFGTGLLTRADWSASWVRGGTQMRKDFAVTNNVRER